MKSPIKWVGGKRKEIKYFEEYIPEFETYVEPFIGGGALLFHLQPNSAIINDLNEHLINFYKVLANDYNKLYNHLQTHTNNKDCFLQIRDKLNNRDWKDEVEQASIFYYINKTCFSGKWRENSKGEFNNSFGNYKRDNFRVLSRDCGEFLKNVNILNEDYKVILDKFKYNANAFIFLDPPYLECDSMYTQSQEFEYIYKYLKDYFDNCKCKCMLVVKDVEYIRNLFNDYIIKEYDVNYSHNATSKKVNNHLVICNY